jgi:hypothetical protein
MLAGIPQPAKQTIPTTVNACFLRCKDSNTPSNSFYQNERLEIFLCFGMTGSLESIYKSIYKKPLPQLILHSTVSSPSKSAASSGIFISSITKLDCSIFFSNQLSQDIIQLDCGEPKSCNYILFQFQRSIRSSLSENFVSSFFQLLDHI